MLRRVCSKVLAFDQTMLPTPTLFRCLRGNLCTTVDENTKNTTNDIDEKKSFRKESSFCNVTMLGRVGTAPKIVPSGDRSFVTFAVAVNGPYTSNAFWHNVYVNRLGQQDFVMNSLGIGDRIIVEGQLRYYMFDNTKIYKINAVDIHLLSKKVAVKSDHQDMNHEEVLEMQEEI